MVQWFFKEKIYAYKMIDQQNHLHVISLAKIISIFKINVYDQQIRLRVIFSVVLLADTSSSYFYITAHLDSK